MRQIPKSAKVAALLMFVSIALTGTPVVVLANRIHPTVLGVPFFLFWASAAPLLAFVFSTIYARITNNWDKDTAQHSDELDDEER